jgi:hypothetical protein
MKPCDGCQLGVVVRGSHHLRDRFREMVEKAVREAGQIRRSLRVGRGSLALMNRRCWHWASAPSLDPFRPVAPSNGRQLLQDPLPPAGPHARSGVTARDTVAGRLLRRALRQFNRSPRPMRGWPNVLPAPRDRSRSATRRTRRSVGQPRPCVIRASRSCRWTPCRIASSPASRC